MVFLENALIFLHLIFAVAICGFVLMQQGKGADMGAAFGSGSSGSLFGASGSANFLSRTTAVLAALFFVSSVGLTWLATTHGVPQGVMEKGVMERLAPKSDVPPAPAGTVAPATGSGTVPAVPGPAAPPTGGSAAPAAPAGGAGPKANEVPK